MCTSTVIYQYLAVVSMNLLNVGYGMAISWPSSSVLILKSFDTPLNNGIPMKDAQISWITSLLGLGGLIGSILTGCIADFLGRKKTLLCLAFPQMASWTLIIMATDATFLYISRFLAGFSAGGVFVVVPVYTAEIAEDRIRGKLGAFWALSINLGILLGFIAGNYLKFFTIPKCALWFSVIHVITFIFFPESPIYLLRKGRLNEAVRALQFYRNSQRMSQRNLEYFKSELEKLINTREANNKTDTGIQWKDFQCKSTRKAFVIGFMVVFMNSLCGAFAMVNYAASIFAEAGSNFSPNVAAIFVGILLFIGNYLSTFLVDRIGRKLLLTMSALGTGLSLSTFGAFSYIASIGYDTSTYNWIPIASFSSMMFIAACGMLPLLTVIISEVMPDKLRTVGTMACICFSWCLAFISVFCFPLLLLVIGLHGCIFIFAGSCFVGAAFAVLYMPETKGKTFYEIRQALEK